MLSPISDKSMSLFFELPELNKQNKSETTNINDRYLSSLIHSSIQSNKPVGDYSTSVVDQVALFLNFDSSPPFSPASSGSDSGISSDIQSQQGDFGFQDLNGDLDDGFHGMDDQLDIDLSDADAHTIQQALDKMVRDQSLPDIDILSSYLYDMQEYKSTENLTNLFSDVDWFDKILGLPEADQNDQIQVDSSCHREDSQVADGYLSDRPSQSMSRNLLPHDHAYSGLNPGRSNSAVTKKSEQEKEKNSRVSGIEIDGESFSRQQIAEMEFEDFNALINGQSPGTAQWARDIRRMEKNKHAARESRKRKADEIGCLENEAQLIRDKVKKMKSENNKISKQINAMKKKCADLEDTLGVKACKLDGEYIVVPRK